ncbi:MAG TPA: TIGR03790 family protein, partial [Opitutus sp.]|nr:TIGR03790 family protein [Opitutus sp.]
SEDPGSLRIARHYAEARSVPAENLIALPMSLLETVSWSEFVETIWNPLRAELVRRNWFDAIPMDLTDQSGRRKYSVANHRIAYLVVARGVPLRIRHDPALYKPTPPQTDNVIFRTNAAAVDGELSLLAQSSHEITGYLPNPLFGYDQPAAMALSQVVKVSRLDGPTVEDALALVDHAISAERNGLHGRAYVDIGGNHPDGDRWLESVVEQLSQLGFETEVDRARTTFPATARFDAPILYFGWYAGNVDGPFTRPDFRFPEGAIALHIHSYSATTLRNRQSGWTGPLVARGVTATVGNVFEPYLQLTHRPDLLVRALARGENFGDAACYAQPALSWHVIAIGDPLYRPFAVSAEEQRQR